jgi:hypothetical protein
MPLPCRAKLPFQPHPHSNREKSRCPLHLALRCVAAAPQPTPLPKSQPRPTASSLDSDPTPCPPVTLRCIEQQFSTELAMMFEPTPANTESAPLSSIIVRIVADHIHAVEALAATSANSLDHATLCTSYENAINLDCALHSSENLADRFATLAAENEDLALK